MDAPEVLSRPCVRIKGNAWRTGQHLLNTYQGDKQASGYKTRVHFNLKPAMALPLQGAGPREVLQNLLSPSGPRATMLMGFLTNQKTPIFLFQASLSCLPSARRSCSHTKGRGWKTEPAPPAPLGEHQAASSFQRRNLSWPRGPSSLPLQGRGWFAFRAGAATGQVYL